MPGPSNRFNVVFLGSHEAGKSAIVNRICRDEFHEEYETTMGAMYHTSFRENMQFCIWDVGGSPRSQFMWPTFLKDAKLCIYCFDLSSYLSNQGEIARHIAQIKASFIDKETTLWLVGTKRDRTTDQINISVICEQLAHTGPVFLVSAKSGEGIGQLVSSMCQKAVAPLHQSIQKLRRATKNLPEEQASNISHEIDELMRNLQSPGTLESRQDAIVSFQDNCRHHVANAASTGRKQVLKAVSFVAVSALVTLIAAMTGFAIGFAAGIWTGPGAFISGVLGAKAATVVVMSISGAIGVGAGLLTTQSLFKPPSDTIMAVEDTARNARIQTVI
ncbi:GTP-binding protein [Legionella spiritensis]|uniref:Rho GTPase (Miro-like) n=1 Tax=Legionella spiritensis TaxID=452 RepID=A0A0W0Z5Y1_LEGSP|nr:GTP-binding protein [Legionella spiritensis]KTD64533.1 Rho GTPase (Miro-like) [Legionella spiritensis]SNV29906.1 Rho GTPase (Miro-like) [Legionella spiritensis]